MSENARSFLRMQETIVLRVVAKGLIPVILLFALYVQFHGDYGPGGGFQAGVMFAAGLILYGLIFGLDELQRLVPSSLVEVGIALGTLIYGGVGVVGMFLGGAFLDYSVLDQHDPSHGQHLGILIVELGLGVAVACVMIMIFYSFAGRAPE